MKGLRLTQKDGTITTVGDVSGRNFVTYTDDFSAWNGRVYLCGFNIQTTHSNRVDGLGPYWCYQKVDIKTSLQSQWN